MLIFMVWILTYFPLSLSFFSCSVLQISHNFRSRTPDNQFCVGSASKRYEIIPSGFRYLSQGKAYFRGAETIANCIFFLRFLYSCLWSFVNTSHANIQWKEITWSKQWRRCITELLGPLEPGVQNTMSLLSQMSWQKHSSAPWNSCSFPLSHVLGIWVVFLSPSLPCLLCY